MEDMISVREKIVLHKETEIEFDWWGDKVVTSEKQGLKKGELVKLPSTGQAYRLIGLLRYGKEPNSARPGIKEMLEEIGTAWRQSLADEKIVDQPENWYLSVTSLYRDRQLERKFDDLPNSNSRSSHETGAAFDLDPRGFYKYNPETEKYQGINRQTKGSKKLREKMSLALRQVLTKKQEQDKINYFPEYNKQTKNPPQSLLNCLHCCLSPEYQQELLK